MKQITFRDEVQEKAALAIAAQKRSVLLLNGSTGLGKTFLGFLAAKEAILQGGTAVIALPYHALINQSLSKVDDFERAGLAASDLAHFKSSSTWASPTRAAALGLEVIDGQTCEEVIERYQESRPDLKVSDICVRSQFCPDSEMTHYAKYRRELKQSKVILCTHTALLINAWTNNRYLGLPNLSKIIVDEADVIGDMAKLLFNRTITQEDFEFLGGCKTIKEPSPESISYYESRCEAKMGENEEHALELLAVFRVIAKNWDNAYCNIKKVGSQWRVRFRKSATILKRLESIPSETSIAPKTIYMSGTLAMRENGFNRFASLVGANDYETCFAVHQRPNSFGKLKFILGTRLSDEEIHELRNHREDWKWTTDVDLTVQAAKEGLKTGHTLILVPSSSDTQAIAAKLPNAVYQAPGENAKHCVKRFVNKVSNNDQESAILIAHGLWAGLDIPGVAFKNVIIPRVPYQAPDECDLDEDFVSNLDRATRKIAQGIGRALRSKDHEATIWILDKRFPLPSSKMAKLGVDNRFVDSHIGLRAAIAGRFDLNYQRAKIAYLEDGKLVLE